MARSRYPSFVVPYCFTHSVMKYFFKGECIIGCNETPDGCVTSKLVNTGFCRRALAVFVVECGVMECGVVGGAVGVVVVGPWA